MQITVPIGGSNVIPEGEGPARTPVQEAPSPLAQRKSLHTVRITPQATPQYEPQWTENMQLKWRPVEQPAEEPAAEQVVESTIPRGNEHPDNSAQPYETLQREMAELKQTMQSWAQSQQPQQPQGPVAPDPTQFDFYDPNQVAEFHKQNNVYMQAQIQQTVQAALAPHQGAMQSAEYTRQYNSVYNDYGNDPNFKPIMDKALQMVLDTGGQYSIPQAYDFVSKVQITSPQTAAPSPSAKPGYRPLTAQEAAQKAAQAQSLPARNGVSGAGEPPLPEALRNVNSLGRIIFHNNQTGRARPI